MAYVRECWDNKEKRAELAKKHCADMAFHFARLISDSVTETEMYFPDFVMEHVEVSAEHKTEFIVADLDSVSAIFEYDAGKTAVLNFSSYKNPGGMFLNGSKAQEECLCHESTLYNVLKDFQVGFYDWNNQHKNKALYLNRGLYSPNIAFIHGGKQKACDVITCAAPNKSAAQKYQNVTDEENRACLIDRIRFVLDIAAQNKVNTLILGAYGCGVFGQDATEVAELFKHYLTTTHKMFDTVVFAVPNGVNGNLSKFREVFDAPKHEDINDMCNVNANDLISREKVMERIIPRMNSARTGSLEHQRLSNIFKEVVEMPIAYDTNKVTDELEEYLFQKYCIEGDMNIDAILKRGGLNAN